MHADIRNILKAGPITASAPCRIDMGGTLDLSTFYIPLRSLKPCTLYLTLFRIPNSKFQIPPSQLSQEFQAPGFLAQVIGNKRFQKLKALLQGLC